MTVLNRPGAAQYRSGNVPPFLIYLIYGAKDATRMMHAARSVS
jgi:hypothetical protein